MVKFIKRTIYHCDVCRHCYRISGFKGLWYAIKSLYRNP